MKCALIVIVLSFVTGCVGVVPFVTGKYEQDMVWKNDVLAYASCGTQGRALLGKCSPGTDVFTPQAAVEKWGAPLSRKLVGDQEYLTFPEGKNLTWRGIILVPLVPVPLMFPVGHNYQTLVFDHGRLVKLLTEGAAGAFYGCGLPPLMELANEPVCHFSD